MPKRLGPTRLGPQRLGAKTSRGPKWFGAETSENFFGESLPQPDRLVYRFLTLYFASFHSGIGTRQLFTFADSNGGIYGRYASETFALRTHAFLLRFCTHTR